jgi:hypothetical protein
LAGGAVVPDEFDTHYDIPYYDLANKRILLPKGAIIRYREWYGSLDPLGDRTQGRDSNKGLKLTAEEIAGGICLREQSEPRNEAGRARINYRVIDPSATREDGGPSLTERMAAHPYHLVFSRADNKRIALYRCNWWLGSS